MKEVDTTQKVLIKNMRAEMKLGKKNCALSNTFARMN